MKALFLGLGGIGQRHLRNLRALEGDGLEVLAVRTRRLSHVLNDQLQVDASRDLESTYGIEVVATLEGALARRPDLVFICSPTSEHVPAALAAARAGCHLFLEKPVSHSLEGTVELLEAVRESGRVSFVGYQLRFHPLVLRLHELVVERAIGDVIAVRAEVGEALPDWHRYEDYRGMYAARRDQGGGVIVTQIHEIDLLYWILGMPRRVFALGGQLSRLEVDVEDVASLSFEVPVNERLIPVHLHQDYVQRPPSRICTVLGDRGKAQLDLRATTLKRWDEAGALVEDVSLPDFARNELFVSELSHVLGCVKTGEESRIPLSEGLQSLRIAVAAKQSLQTGSVVTLGDVP